MGELSDYNSIQIRNREVFEKNYASDATAFNEVLLGLQAMVTVSRIVAPP
jgi:hypothetical protein